MVSHLLSDSEMQLTSESRHHPGQFDNTAPFASFHRYFDEHMCIFTGLADLYRRQSIALVP
jgi:hypothetical protein